MNKASEIRRRADLEKLKVLQNRIPRTLEITQVVGDPPTSFRLLIRIPTARNCNYPQQKQEINEVEILLPDSYPFPPGPIVNFITPIWNPNVFDFGRWCFGEWNVTENLELFVIRLMKVIALDPEIINPKSAANVSAAVWYQYLYRQRPELFPTISIAELLVNTSKPKIIWRNIK